MMREPEVKLQTQYCCNDKIENQITMPTKYPTHLIHTEQNHNKLELLHQGMMESFVVIHKSIPALLKVLLHFLFHLES